MKIWHITSEVPIPGILSGGMGIHVWNIAREQAALGHEVVVFCPLKAEQEHDGVRFCTWEYHVPKFEHESSFNIEAARRTTKRLFRQAKVEGKPDIVHCHEWDSAPVAIDLAEYLGVPCVSTLHLSNTLNQEFMTPHHMELHSYFHWWEQEMMRRSDAMIAISKHYADWIRMFNRGRPIRTIPNGVNVDDFQNGVVREKPDGRTLAFFHGRLCGQKGIDIIVEAAKQRQDIYWVLAGPIAAHEDGRCLEDGLYSDLLELQREGKVLLTGMIPQTEIGAWLRACDVAVYPHKRAPFDCAVLEAMACGACVVTTGVDAIAEYADSRTVVFIEPNAASLLYQIDSLGGDLRERVICAAKDKASQFTWKKTALETLNYYEEIINANKDNTKHYASA